MAAQLQVDGVDVAPVETAKTFGARLRGLLGRRSLDGALLLRPGNSVHTLGMAFPLDVAHCDADLRVLRTTTMARHRVGRPVRGSAAVLEAEAGSFDRWKVRPGAQLAVTGTSTDTGDTHRRRAVKPT